MYIYILRAARQAKTVCATHALSEKYEYTMFFSTIFVIDLIRLAGRWVTRNQSSLELGRFRLH